MKFMMIRQRNIVRFLLVTNNIRQVICMGEEALPGSQECTLLPQNMFGFSQECILSFLCGLKVFLQIQLCNEFSFGRLRFPLLVFYFTNK
ncbi:hypothetical protein P8452_47733 [Trifolium repens]|nr:hypothetical protein P8452_47733 [Trifolium repens]